MSFVSVQFISFLVILFILYYIIPKKLQWLLLLAASYIYYLLADPRAIIFIAGTTVSVFFTGRWLDAADKKHSSIVASLEPEQRSSQRKTLKAEITRKKRGILTLGLLIIFGVLAYIKYGNFTLSLINNAMSAFGSEYAIPRIDVLLPLGISFYTFQVAGYLFDVYRNKYPAATNIAKFALFVSFFPQIVQGPINRYNDLAPQFEQPHAFDYNTMKYGAQRIVWGYFKKMVIADRAAFISSWALAADNFGSLQGFSMAFAVLAFMLQVYADFSGGIDIVLGIAQCLGITMPENFRRPHFAQSLSEYWRRWHITLGLWMKDYVLFPISLSKPFARLGKRTRKWFGKSLGKQIPTCIAMGIVFMLVGIWHGAGTKYIAFGLYNGGIITLGIFCQPLLEWANKKYNIVNTKTASWRLFRMGYTFFIVFVGKCFAMTDTGARKALTIIKKIFTSFNPWVITDGTLYNMGLDAANVNLLILCTVLLLVVGIFQEKGLRLREALARQNILFRWGIYVAAVMSIFIFGYYGIGYSAASFIYQGF